MRSRKRIAITIEDGPNKNGTVRYLNLSKKYKIPFTFFVVGKQVAEFPEQIGAMLDAGCEVGNHSMQHLHLTQLSPEEMQWEIEDCDRAILDAASDAQINCIRAPYLESDSLVSSKIDRPLISASVQEAGKNGDATYDRIMDAQDGDIILLRSWNEESMKALEDAIPELKKSGTEFLTVSELFRQQGIRPVAGKVYASVPAAAAAVNADDRMDENAERNGRRSEGRTSNGDRNPQRGRGNDRDRIENTADQRMNRQPNMYGNANQGMNRQDMRRNPENNQGKQGRVKHKHKKLRAFLITILVLLLLFFIGMYALTGVAYSKMTYKEVESVTSLNPRSKGVTNILLIGTDSRDEEEAGRSDSMILMSISSNTHKIQLTSFLRDSYVEIPGHGSNRLNAAYAYGGAELLMETIEQNFGVDVNRYVQVDFYAFVGVVDAVGGVDLELTNDEVKLVNGYLWEYNNLIGEPEGTDYLDESLSGVVHLDGAQALAYSRNRYIGTDFARTNRQRVVIDAVIQKLPKALLTNGNEVIDKICSNLTTNLTHLECTGIAMQAPVFLTYERTSESVPIDGSWTDATIDSMAVLQIDFDKNKEFLQESLY